MSGPTLAWPCTRSPGPATTPPSASTWPVECLQQGGRCWLQPGAGRVSVPARNANTRRPARRCLASPTTSSLYKSGDGERLLRPHPRMSMNFQHFQQVWAHRVACRGPGRALARRASEYPRLLPAPSASAQCSVFPSGVSLLARDSADRCVTVQRDSMAHMEYTGARITLRTLLAEGVDTLFGIPGGAVLPLCRELHAEPALRHILVRHEQGAGHAARGYAQASGRVGVCVATSGPGATNLVTPLMDAFMDSVPVLALTGQVPRHLLGTSAFQETDICAIAAPVTKEAVQVTDAADIAGALRHALHTALAGRPCPGRHHQGRPPGQGRPTARRPRAVGRTVAARLRRDRCPGRRTALRAAPRALRRWRDRRLRSAPCAGRPRRNRPGAGGHHPHGARRLPGRWPRHSGTTGDCHHPEPSWLLTMVFT